jgi:hypothetical protein
VVVVVNSALTILLARWSWSIPSLVLAFVDRLAVNVVLVIAAEWLLNREGGDVNAWNAMFFLSLISLITTLHDRYRPVLATRVAAERAARAQDA